MSVLQGVMQGVCQGVTQGINNFCGGPYIPPPTNLRINCDASLIDGVIFQATVASGQPINALINTEGNNFLKPAPNQPSWVENVNAGLGAVRSNRLNFEHLQMVQPFSGTTPSHWFLVMKGLDASSIAAGAWAIGSQLSGDYYTFSDNKIFSAMASNTRRDCGVPPVAANVMSILEFWSGPGSWGCAQNGVTLLTVGVNTVAYWGSGDFFIFVNAVGVYGSYDVQQIVAFDAIQSASARAGVLAGLNKRFNLF